MRGYVFTFFLAFISIQLAAQQEDRPDRCHTSQYHQELMQNADYAEAHEEMIENARKWIKSHPDETKMDCDEILYIPVAVHFQREGTTDIAISPACAEEMALSQIDAINADFAGTNSDITKWQNGQATWPAISNGESCIQFCLATLDHPAGSGIAEGDYAITINEYDFTTNIPEWSGYMNWFIRDITNPLGFSPFGGNGNGDGIVCGLTYFGTSNCLGNLSPTFNLGRTLTHEVGHYLLLEHPFESGNCTADGDGIGDTPFTDQESTGCFADGEVVVNCTEPVLWPTYMEYCDDACLYMFTEDQVTTMTGHVNASLTNLLNSATTKCQDAACIEIAMEVIAIEESCETGQDGSVQLLITNGASPIQYSFDGGQSFEASDLMGDLEEGRYDVQIIDAAGCVLIDSVFLQREKPPVQILDIKNAFCGNNDGSVLAEVNFDDDFEFNIGNGWQDTAYFDGLASANYLLKVRNEAGCGNSKEFTISDDSDLELNIISVRQVNCPLLDNGKIEAKLLNGEPPFEFRLNQSDPKPEGKYENLSPGQYVLSVEDTRGCKEEYEFTINVSFANIANDCPCEVFIPNAMTPGDDALNNTFKPIPSCPITDYSFQVFDRWGDMVFETRNLEEVWNGGDGEYFGQSQLYYYKMTYRWGERRNESLELQQKNGFITVLR